MPGEESAIEAFYKSHTGAKGLYAVDGGSTESLADALERAALDGPGMNPPPGIAAEIGSEQSGGDSVAGMGHHRQ